jgi:cellulose synthase/poly-beta-1,6-N-acetylglucosamine synthase-like glycosyltransferase
VTRSAVPGAVSAPGEEAEPGGDDHPAARVSVVICAYTRERRAATLAAVASVREQSAPAHEVILVVDHNPALHRDLAAALPGVRVLPNVGRPGLSGGKNTGVQAAAGEIVAFLDDDAVAHPDWLASLASGYRDRQVLGVGGLTRPAWAGGGRPRWFPGELDWVVGCTYTGMPPSPAAVRNLHGGNASFRRTAFAAAGGFADGIGRSARGPRSGCEDTEFCIRLARQVPGARFLFDDRAVIWHQVPATRSGLGYVVARCYAEGLSKAQVTRLAGLSEGLATERGYVARALPRGIARALSDVASGDLSGAGRAGAIIVALTAATAGFACGRARAITMRPRRWPR